MRTFLITLLFLLALAAIAGGGMLIIAPDGRLLEMPLSILEKSPFENFLIPGIILFLVLGVTPILTATGLIKKSKSVLAEKLNMLKDMHWSWTFTLYIASADILWIQIQMQFIKSVSWLHTFYVLFGLLIILVALMQPVRNFYKKDID